MKRNNFWKWLVVAFVTLWAISEIYPPSGRDLIEVFQEKATAKDQTFSQIVARAQELQKENPDRKYGNLLDAVGTNDIRKYFPNVDTKAENNPTLAILNRVEREAAGKIRLGLDLQGGTQFLVSLDTNRVVKTGTNKTDNVELEEETKRNVEQAVEVLRRRVDKFGVAEPIIAPQGANRILIQLPGLSSADKDRARSQIQKAAFLEFRMVHPESDQLLAQGIVEPGYEVLNQVVKTPEGGKALQPFLVKKRPERGLTGAYIQSAGVIRDPVSNQPQIDFTLNTEGAKIFAEVTRENIGRLLAIVLDGELYSAPRIQGEIPGGRGQITGSFDLKEAFELANVLENPLATPVKIDEAREVDPSLGKDSVRSGFRAAIGGLLAVAVFMIVYYLLGGVIAIIALVLNVVITLGVMASIGTVLTLPGIAGIVLGLGMAIDANVLIFERIREELNAGKSLRGAINAGYAKAFGTIFDANLTTLIASILLIIFGTGPVKGFGVTLTIGVAASMFTALVVTRLIFDFLFDRNMLNNLKMLSLIKGSNINFLKWAKPAFIASWLLIIIGIGYGFYRGKSTLGVDFAGGDSVTVGFAQRVAPDKVREALGKIDMREPVVQYQKDIAAGKEVLNIVTEFGKGTNILAALQSSFPDAKFTALSQDQVGPTVGEEITKSAIIAGFLALFCILIYVAFRYEFSFAIGAVVAVIHDVLMTLGWFFLTDRQLNAPIVAAILTIIGFSINDTIVIFDRIREDLKLGVRGSFADVINRAINETLGRTIITSGTVFLTTLSLYLFGGPVINDFSFMFLVGVLVGTYSTIYIASALVLWWNRGERPKIMTAPVPVDETPTAGLPKEA